MVNKELRKLRRRELVDIIYQMKKNEQLLHDEIASLQESLQEKRIRISEVGSIAEAAVSITNVFSSAQTAADLYLQEIASMKQDAEMECARIIEEAKQKAAEIIAESEKQCANLKAQYPCEYENRHELQQEEN